MMGFYREMKKILEPYQSFSSEEMQKIKENIPHGTTIMALLAKDGVVIAGDRQASAGYSIAHREYDKIVVLDKYTAIGIAGTVKVCIDSANLLRRHFKARERMDGIAISVDGKVNVVGHVMAHGLMMFIQLGILFLPVFAAYDKKEKRVRLFDFDVLGQSYERFDFVAEGSGKQIAKSFLEETYEPGLEMDKAVKLACNALYRASDSDLGTGGPDFLRDIFPTVKTITKDGVLDIRKEEVAEIFKEIREEHKQKHTRREAGK